MRLRFYSLLLSLLLPGSAALAANASPAIPSSFQIPPALTAALRGGLTIAKQFSGPSDLTGWLMKDGSGTYYTMFTTADGQVLIAGALLDAQGVNLTQKYQSLYAPKPDLSGLWKRFEHSTYIVSGTLKSPKSTIYVVMDPNCIFCHLLWVALQPYEAKGLQVRWVPVGFLKADSYDKAAALLAGGDAALTRSQNTFDVQTESAGIAKITPTDQERAELDANLKLMHAAEVRGTPGIFYKDAKGTIERQDGFPHFSQLPAITGLAQQPETDPRLARMH